MLRNLLEIVGFIVFVIALWLMWEPLGLAALGIGLIAAANVPESRGNRTKS